MEKPQRKLWRKIGLQKNFLEGTSHSDDSRNTFSRQQFSHDRTQSEHSHKILQNQKLFSKQKDKILEQENMNERNSTIQEVNSEKYSLQSPIDKLNFQSFEQRYALWNKQLQKITPIDENIEHLEKQAQNQNPMLFSGLNAQYLDDVSIKNSILINSQSSFNLNQNKQFSISQQSKQSNQLQLMKIRINPSKKNQSHPQFHQYNNKYEISNNIQRKNQEIQCIQCQQLVTLSPSQFERYERIEKILIKIKLNRYPKITAQINNFREILKLMKKQLNSKLLQYKRFLMNQIKMQLTQQIQQYTDEIGYLYKENGDLMRKIQENQNNNKKLEQDFKILQLKLIQTQNKQSDGKNNQMTIMNQQNEINKLYEKLQDFQQLQSKNQVFKMKVSDLQSELTNLKDSYISLTHTVQDQQSIISAKQIKITHFQDEINRLCITFQEKQYIMKKQFQQQFNSQEKLFITKLAKQKQSTQKQIQKKKLSREQQIQKVAKQYQNVMEELIKQINSLQVQNIIKKFDIQKNQYMSKVFNKVNQFKVQKDQLKENTRNNKLNGQIDNKESIKLSPKSDSNKSNSLNKNLRATGFFGQVGKPNLNIRLDDIQHKYSSEIDQNDDELMQQRVTFDTNSISERRRSVITRDDLSQISCQSYQREVQIGRANISPYYNKYMTNKQKRIQLLKQNQQIRKTGLNHKKKDTSLSKNNNDEGVNYLDLKSTNQRIKTQNYSDHHEDNSIFHKNANFNLPIDDYKRLNQNHNYSFSQLHFNSNLDTPNYRETNTTPYFQKAQTHRQSYKNNSSYTVANKYGYQPKTNQQKADIVQKIKQRLKQKFKSKDDQQPSYNQKYSNIGNKKLFRESQYNHSRPMKQENMMLANFYQKQHPTQSNYMNMSQNLPSKQVSGHSTSRSPRSISPSNSIGTSRINANINKPCTGTNNYSKINKPTGNIISATFNKSSIERGEFIAQSRKPTVGGYQPKGSLYQINKTDLQGGNSSYVKKY